MNFNSRSCCCSCSRCVQGEGEIEKLQAKMVEMRRKLDDTTAAMQELGRENQSLQVRLTPTLDDLNLLTLQCCSGSLAMETLVFSHM